MPQLSWIGLGNMGRGMVRNIVAKAGLETPLVVFNRSVKRSQDLRASLGDPDKVRVANSLEEAVSGADIVFTSLAGDASVEEVFDSILNSPGVGGVEGKLFVEMSTILPATTNALAEKVRSSGGGFVAAPVFGAPVLADSGMLVVALAGPSSVVDRVVPYCDGVISRATIDLRDREPGTATLLKVTANTFILAMVETLAEGHVFAEKSGLGSDILHKLLATLLPACAPYSSRMMSGDYMRQEPLFAVDLARKDANHAVNLGAEVGVDLKLVKVVRAHLDELKTEAGPAGDLPGIYGVVRKESGLPFSNLMQ